MYELKINNTYTDMTKTHTTHYVCDEMIEKYGSKVVGCCCTGHKCKTQKEREEIDLREKFRLFLVEHFKNQNKDPNLSQKDVTEMVKWIDQALSQKEEEIRREVYEDLLDLIETIPAISISGEKVVELSWRKYLELRDKYYKNK